MEKVQLKLAVNEEIKDQPRNEVRNEKSVYDSQSRWTVPVVGVQRLQSSPTKANEADRAPDAKGNEQGKYALVVAAADQRLFIERVHASAHRLVCQIGIRPAVGKSFAPEQILRYLRNHNLPNQQPPFRRPCGILFRGRIDFHGQKTQSPLHRQG